MKTSKEKNYETIAWFAGAILVIFALNGLGLLLLILPPSNWIALTLLILIIPVTGLAGIFPAYIMSIFGLIPPEKLVPVVRYFKRLLIPRRNWHKD